MVVDPLVESLEDESPCVVGVDADADEAVLDAQCDGARSHGGVGGAPSRVRRCGEDLGAVLGD